jgi:MYXO-CTERM domain-containing protein
VWYYRTTIAFNGSATSNHKQRVKFKFVTILGTAMLPLLSITTSAAPVSGNIGLSGTAQLNSGSAQTATEVVSWGDSTVGADSGSFASITPGTAAVMSEPWTFNSGVLNNYWTVGGFTFNLSSSSIYSQNGGFLNVVMQGTVLGNGYDPTAFIGTFQVADPSANGSTTFTERMSFTGAPEPGTSLWWLGLTALGLALVRRKNRRA